MESAALRQAFAAVPVMPARPDVYAPRDAVTTELPAGQSVSAGQQTPAVHNDVSQHSAALGRLAGELLFDRPKLPHHGIHRYRAHP